ncbi:MAG: aminopeptidase [Ruminococcaceae bacterium]|nr:aminopeptidase [Oscillospiraceae bacterium]
MSDKTKGQMMKEELFYKKKNAFETKTQDELKAAKDYAVGYAEYLDASKTEREAVLASIELLEKAGYKAYNLGDKISAGDKLYLNNRGKGLFAIKVGTENIENGVRICAAHIDSPRLDLKQHPLFENDGFAYFKTHYYGGIRKYQWATIPLALHGVVLKANGETVNVRIGDEAGDPVLCITDLLPHLAKDQNQKPLGQAFTGEGLNVILGTSPYFEEDGKVTPSDEKVKLNIMIMLNEKYGITESDFISAELSIVPAQNTVDVGLDRWLLGAYGHDDRVCAYPALTGIIEAADSAKTCVVALADKEEVGSDGVAGMQSCLLFDIIDELAKNLGGNTNVVRMNSKCLSADVTACHDPNYPEVSEKRNAAILHCGIGMSKYTGSGGKGGTNDCPAEFVSFVRNLFDGEGVIWQTAELGKVDQGGGGTVAKYIANRNIDTVDVGVPVLSMHAPFELISKSDLYEAHRAFAAFCK